MAAENASLEMNSTMASWSREEELRLIRSQLIVVVEMILFPIVVCFGFFGNIITIVVLTRPWMKSSTNYYLTALAIYDILYLVFAFSMGFHHYPNIGRQTAYVFYRAYVGRTLTDTWSNTGIWLTVTFTVERYVVVCHPMKGKVWCTPKRAKHILVAVCLSAALATFPEFFSRRVVEVWDSERNATTAVIGETDFAATPGYKFGYQYTIQVLFTFLPLVLLSAFNVLLVRALVRAAERRSAMTQTTNEGVDQQRITLMLICVVIVFLFCQLPSAVALLYSNVVKVTATEAQILELKIASSVCNLLVMINSSVNFVLYSSFSTKFRVTFRRVFCRCAVEAEAGGAAGRGKRMHPSTLKASKVNYSAVEKAERS